MEIGLAGSKNSVPCKFSSLWKECCATTVEGSQTLTFCLVLTVSTTAAYRVPCGQRLCEPQKVLGSLSVSPFPNGNATLWPLSKPKWTIGLESLSLLLCLDCGGPRALWALILASSPICMALKHH
jgi:hypothetical protein